HLFSYTGNVLCRDVQKNVIFVRPFGNAAVSFQAAMGDDRRAVVAFMRDFGLLKSGSRVAYRLLLSDFVQFTLLRFGEIWFFVAQHKVGKLIVFDLDGAHSIPRGRLVDGSNGNDVGSSPEHFTFRAIVRAVDDVNGLHARHFLGRGSVDAFYAGMSVGTLHAVAVEHFGANNVIGVLGSS